MLELLLLLLRLEALRRRALEASLRTTGTLETSLLTTGTGELSLLLWRRGTALDGESTLRTLLLLLGWRWATGSLELSLWSSRSLETLTLRRRALELALLGWGSLEALPLRRRTT